MASDGRDNLRKLWLSLHRYLGLCVGAVLAILGLTGSILAFHSEVNAWLYPELQQVSTPPPGTPYRPFPELMAAIRSALPPEGKLEGMSFPYHGQRALGAGYTRPVGNDGKTETHGIVIDPYTAKVVGTQRFYGTNPLEHCLMGVIWKLHYALLLPDDYGLLMVGTFGLFLMVSVCTGLYL